MDNLKDDSVTTALNLLLWNDDVKMSTFPKPDTSKKEQSMEVELSEEKKKVDICDNSERVEEDKSFIEFTWQGGKTYKVYSESVQPRNDPEKSKYQKGIKKNVQDYSPSQNRNGNTTAKQNSLLRSNSLPSSSSQHTTFINNNSFHSLSSQNRNKGHSSSTPIPNKAKLPVQKEAHNGEKSVRRVKLQGHVGIDCLPEELVKRRMKKGYAFNILLIGETGIGKSTLMDSLFNTTFDSSPSPHNLSAVKLKAKTYDLQENNVNLRLTIVDTVGYGDQINKENSFKVIVDYIDSQFEMFLEEELKIKRSLVTYHDTRIHGCLYFISPTGHGLKSIDLVCMKKLDSKVNIIPIIAKSDTISKVELQKLKFKIMNELVNNGIQIYQAPTDDDSVLEINSKMNDLLPFAVVGSRDFVRVGMHLYRARQYPWGTVKIENENHCDFAKLREMLIRTNMEDMRDQTHARHYQLYRRMRLAQMGFSDVGADNKPISFQETYEQKHQEHLQKQQQQPPLLNTDKDAGQSPTAGMIDLTNDSSDEVSMEDQDISRVVEASFAESKAVGTKQKQGEAWQDPVSVQDRQRNGDWPVGLKNVGNTCWFSTVIQSLFHLPIFRQLVLSYSPRDWNVTATDRKEKQNLLFMQELRHLFALLMSSKRKYVDPSHALEEFKEAFSDSSGTCSQQDVSEFSHKLLERLEEAFKLNSYPHHIGDISVNMMDGHEQNPMFDLFHGEFLSEGHNQGQSFCIKEAFGQYPLQVYGFSNIYESLEASMIQEIESSDVMTKSGHESWFTRLPPVMFFELSRFRFNQQSGRPEKIHSKFEFPQVMFMDRYMEHNKSVTRCIRDKVKKLKEEKEKLHKLHSQLEKMGGDLSSDIELKVPHSYLKTWRKEIESTLKNLQQSINDADNTIKGIYNDPSLQEKRYRLHAVLVHQGEAELGHYWAYIYCPNRNHWLKFNDENVSEATWSDIQRDSTGGQNHSSAYCLLYVDDLRSELFDVNTVFQIGPENLTNLPADLQRFVKEENDAFLVEMELEDFEKDSSTMTVSDGDYTIIVEKKMNDNSSGASFSNMSMEHEVLVRKSTLSRIEQYKTSSPQGEILSEAIAERDKGNEFYKQKKFEEALAQYDKAIELDPTEMTFLTNKSAIYFERKEYEKCVKECDKAIEVGLQNRADFIKFAKAYSRMAAAYTKLIEIYKRKTSYQKSLIEHWTRDTVTKLSDIKKIIQEEEKENDLNIAQEEDKAGDECFLKGDYFGAVKHYNEAIRRNPDAFLYKRRVEKREVSEEFKGGKRFSDGKSTFKRKFSRKFPFIKWERK